MGKQRVLRVKVSPLNPLQWNLSLNCGHDVWVTRKGRPSMKEIACERCKKPAQLDPDFRRDPKTDIYCVRCQKDIADPNDAIRVTVNWETWLVTLGGKELIGKDCAKKIGLT